MSTVSPKVLKQFEKEIAKEGEAEEARIKDAMRELSMSQKEQEKARKAVLKAESELIKAKKKETEGLAALHKAQEEHEITVAHVNTAQKEFELRKEHDTKLHEQADTRKAHIEAAIKEQQTHNEAREAKIAELRHSGCPHSATSGSMGITSPASGTGSSGPGSIGGGLAPCTGGEYSGSGMATGSMTYPPRTGGTYGGEPVSHSSMSENKAQVGAIDQAGGASGLTTGEPAAGGQSACSQKTNSGGGTQSMPGDYAAR